MPEGIVPELLLVGAFVVLIIGAYLIGRPGRRRPGDEARRGGVDVLERHEAEAPAGEPIVEVAPADEATVVETPPVEAPARPTLRERLARSRQFLGSRLAEALGGGADDEIWDDVEAALIQADVGVETATRLTEQLRARAREEHVTDPAEIKGLLADELVALFGVDRERALSFSGEPPSVWMIVGVNGTGKTTTIGKLAYDLSQRGHTVALAAADTFRAAADEQLAVWADRASAELVKHQPGADPGAVAFDAFKHARARGTDVLIVDTAGRLHTKTPLMDELAKVRRVLERDGTVEECLLVLDATAGQNGLVQAREFAEAAGVTGVVLTKLDGTAKGGIALAIEETLGIPIKLIGVGEGIDDVEPFLPKAFVDALLS